MGPHFLQAEIGPIHTLTIHAHSGSSLHILFVGIKFLPLVITAEKEAADPQTYTTQRQLKSNYIFLSSIFCNLVTLMIIRPRRKNVANAMF